MNQTRTREKWETQLSKRTWGIVILFIVLMTPFGKVYDQLKENVAVRQAIEDKAEEILAEAKSALSLAKEHQANPGYSFLDFAQDYKTLSPMQEPVETLTLGFPQEATGLKYEIENNLQAGISQLTANNPQMEEFAIHEGIAKALNQVGFSYKPADLSFLKTMGNWYLVFILFAFVIFCLRLYYNPYYSLKEELILGLPRLLFCSAFWPIGLSFFPHDGDSSSQNKVNRLLGKLCAKRNLNWWQAREYEAGFREEVVKPIAAFDRAVERVEKLPQTVREKGRFATMVTSLMATLFSPIISKADEMLEVVFFNGAAGNNLAFVYDHIEMNWQTNLTVDDKGGSIQALAGPQFKTWKLNIKPEAGLLLNTKGELGIDTVVAGLSASMSATTNWPLNAWSLNKYFINFKDRLKQFFSFELAAHYMLGALGLENVGLGLGVNGTLTPYAKTNAFTGNFGPRCFLKISDSIMLEAALGFDFDELNPSMFRLLALVPF